MTKYFSKDTPLASLERMMMSVPGFQKRGGGMMVLCRFHYKKEDVDCAYCQSYMRHTCQASVCPYIPERLEAGTVSYQELAEGCLHMAGHQKLWNRLSSLPKGKSLPLVLEPAHRRRLSEWLEAGIATSCPHELAAAYDCTIELLEPLEIGDTLRQDCQVDELDSFYTVLNALIGTQVTLDELDYLAKRLDSFDDGEAAQFQGMAHKLGLSKIKDLINLTFCCQKATVITDFSDLEKIGREHYMNLNGGCARTEDLEALDGTETAYLLIDSGAGTVTPYGVAYDNSMKLEPLYNGRQFPEYLYDNSSMGLKIVPAENQAPELLWLPASEQQIRRTLLRAGWQDPDHADYTIDVFLLQKEAGRILNEKRDSLHSLNAMCGAIAKLEQKDRDKLEAVIVFAEPENAGAIRRLAENLEQFDFIPGIHTPEEYGRYMIRESGRFEYDDILEAFYDYEGYGQHRIQQENGRFSGYGYVSYPGTMALEDLMAEDPAEAYQAEQGLQMGGLE